MQSNLFLACLFLPAISLAVASRTEWCDRDLSHTFHNEKGTLSLSWDFSNNGSTTYIIVQFDLPGRAYIGIGWGGGMVNTDMNVGWVTDSGDVFISDYYSTAHAPPSEDTALGGINNVIPICGGRFGDRTWLRFARELETGDKLDKDLSTSGTQKIVWAWNAVYSPGELNYHLDNHSFAEIDFDAEDGVPANQFGDEETGLAARQLLNSQRWGTLITLQTQVYSASILTAFGASILLIPSPVERKFAQ